MNYTFPNTINGGGALKSKVFLPEEVGSDLPVTMWYFENSFGVVCKVLHDLRISEGLCKHLQRNAQSTTLSLGGLIQPLLVRRL